MALSCYARAMDHVGVMADDPAFRWVDRVILDLHFDACFSRARGSSHPSSCRSRSTSGETSTPITPYCRRSRAVRTSPSETPSWSVLEELVERRRWPDRLAIALEQSLYGGVDRGTYAAEADVAAPTASIDLRRLVDADLVVQEGRGRATRYRASAELRSRLGRRLGREQAG
jgi:DNA-binding transcriptional ArsR family regulator